MCSNKIVDLNIHVFNVITGKNESKVLMQNFNVDINVGLMEKNVIQINGRITINVCVSVKKRHACEKDYILNPATCSCQNGKYLASTMGDSVITFDEIIESYSKETNFNEKKIT